MRMQMVSIHNNKTNQVVGSSQVKALKPSRGIFIGRFQPLHKGHLVVIEKILKEVDELIIVIGSSQRSHELFNPFTTGERLLMIRSALKEAKLPEDRLWLIPIPDIDRNPLWVAHVQSYCPKFQRVYSNNSLVKELFNDQNIPVHTIRKIKRNEYSSTKIRQLMVQGNNWKSGVPNAVIHIIEDIQGESRLKKLAEKD